MPEIESTGSAESDYEQIIGKFVSMIVIICDLFPLRDCCSASCWFDLRFAHKVLMMTTTYII